MTDVWKSNPRKFCELCKVWFADNRVSIEHHEAGQKHKAAVEAKLRELGKQNKEKERANASLQATLAMMEAAAQNSMKSSPGSSSSANLPCGVVGPMPKPRSYIDPRAHNKSVADMAKEMARRKKEKEEQKNYAVKSEHWRGEGENVSKKEKEIFWVEAKHETGIPYYFHMYSGETRWDPPEAFYTAEQYVEKLATMDRTMSYATCGAGEAATSSGPAPRRDWGASEDDGQKFQGNCKQKQNRAARRATVPRAPEAKPMDGEVPYSVDVADIPRPDAGEPALGSERYASEAIDSTAADGVAMASTFRIEDHDIPLPPSHEESTSIKEESVNIKEEPQDVADNDLQMPSIKKEPEEESSEVKEEEEKWKAKCEPDLSESAARSRSPNGDSPRTDRLTLLLNANRQHPYGSWTRVEEKVEKPKTDYELPTEGEGRKSKTEIVIRPEDAVEFTEKTAPIHRKKKANDAPVEFKKRKTNRSVRQRRSDD